MNLVGIYNLALGRIGASVTVASVNENSKEARLCNRFYEQCRDEVLEAGGWPFAIKAEPLAYLGESALEGWGLLYDRPSDALRILDVVPAGSQGAAYSHWCGCSGPWSAWPLWRGAVSFQQTLSSGGNGTNLLANIEGAWAIYVARVENPAVFSPLMVSAVADRLAMELAMPLTAKESILQLAMTRYNASFQIAAATAYEQGAPGADHLPPGIVARS